MKRLFTTLALAAAAFSASAGAVFGTGELVLNGWATPGQAVDGVVSGNGELIGAGMGALSATFKDPFFTEGDNVIPQPFTVFCVDLFSNAGYFGQTSLQYDQITGVTTEINNANALSKLFTFNGGLTSANPTGSAALQLAVWELLYDGEGGSLGTGIFQTVAVDGTVVAQANALLAGAATSFAGYDLTLFSDNGTADGTGLTANGGKQDYVYATRNTLVGGSCSNGNSACDVPEPGSLALAGLGLFGIFGLSRKSAKVVKA